MSSELRVRRGTDTQHNSFTGAESEITVNTTNKSVHVHDGTTAGGFELARADLNNVSNSDFLTKANAAGVSGGGGGASVATITGATQADPVVITTSASHGFVDGTEIQITDVVGMTQLNGNTYYVDVLTSTTFALYSNVELSASVDGAGFGAYSSGGEAAAATTAGAPIDASYIVVSAEGGLPNDRRLQAGTGITITDGGAGGAISVAANLGSSTPSNLGSAAAGVSTSAARADHVHAMPSATDVGAVPTARQVLAGTGLTGGGALSSNVTLSLSASLNNLTDVTVTSAANGDVLIYNDATSRFENSQNFAKNSILKDNVSVVSNTINKLNFIGSGITATVNSSDSNRIDVDFSGLVTTEAVQDIVGSMVSDNTESGISVTYDDPNGKLNFNVNDPVITLTGDVTGSATMTNLGNVSITTTISADSVALGSDTTGNYVSAVTAGTGIILTNGAAGLEGAIQTIALDLDGKPNLAEFISDTVGSMITGNTESGIVVTYDDADNTIDFDVNDFTITLAGDLTGSTTITNLGNATLTATIAADSVALGTDTTGNYVASVVAGTGITLNNGASGLEGAIQTIALDLDGKPNLAEFVSDTVGGMISGNTESGIVVTYDDNDNTIDFDVNDFTITLAGDLTGSVTVTNLANATLSATVAANSVALGTDTTGNYVAAITAGTGIAVSGSGSETANVTVSVDATNATFIESIQDIVGAMVSSNTESGITVTYQDTDGTLDFNVNDPTITLTGDVAGSGVLSNLADLTISCTVQDDSHNHIISNIDGLQTELTALDGRLDSLETGTFGALSTETVRPKANLTYDLGSSSLRWNNVYAITFNGTAVAAQYADLAERYESDSEYPHGTIVKLGGTKEITATREENDAQVLGVISQNPAYIMNDGAGPSNEWLPVAMTGRVPVKIEGPVTKGQRIVTSNTPGVGKAVNDDEIVSLLTVVGRALTSNSDSNIKLVECVVGKL